MKPSRPVFRRIAVFAVALVVVSAALTIAPMGVLSQDNGVDVPPPEDGEYDCTDFETREQVGAVFDPSDDEFGLDRNDNDVACESVGENPTPEAPGAAAADEPTATPTEEVETATPTPTEEAASTQAETESVSEEDSTTEAAAPTASVVFNNQTTDGTTVVVESVTLSEGGFVAIHNASLLEGNVFGSVIGVSEPLPAGTHENVVVTLFVGVPGQNFAEGMTLEESQTLIAMPHLDTNDNGVYDFVTLNGAEDGPYTADGSAVVDPAFVTVEDAEDDEGAPVCEPGSTDEVLGENDEDDDGDGAIDEDDEDNEGPSNDDDDGDGAVDEDDECDDGDDGSDDFNSEAEDDEDGDGAIDEDDEPDSGNSDDVDNDGDGAVDEDDEPDTDD